MGAPPDSEPAPVSGFHLVHRVAQSYLGSLWVALDQRLGEPGKPVLLRCLQLPSPTPVEALQRMACAGRDAMALSHENVLSVIGVVQQEDSLGLTYAYVEAEPLRSLQSWAALRGLSFPLGVSLRITIDLLRGVKALHGALVGWPSAPPFGGVSPDSVLIARDGRTRLCDPLISSCAALLEGIGQNTAKLSYAAPEQVHATEPLAPTSDVFACGVMLWELLAGRRLLSGTRASIERKLLEHDLPELRDHARAEVSDALVALVERSLASDAAKRPATPAAFALELEQCGHEVASVAQVAQFMAELAGPYFERRAATMRTRLPVALHGLLQPPIETAPLVLGRKGARPAGEPSSGVPAPVAAKQAPAATPAASAPAMAAAASHSTPRHTAVATTATLTTATTAAAPKAGLTTPAGSSARRLVPLPSRAGSGARTLIGVAPMAHQVDAPPAPGKPKSPPTAASKSSPEVAASKSGPELAPSTSSSTSSSKVARFKSSPEVVTPKPRPGAAADSSQETAAAQVSPPAAPAPRGAFLSIADADGWPDPQSTETKAEPSSAAPAEDIADPGASALSADSATPSTPETSEPTTIIDPPPHAARGDVLAGGDALPSSSPDASSLDGPESQTLIDPPNAHGSHALGDMQTELAIDLLGEHTAPDQPEASAASGAPMRTEPEPSLHELPAAAAFEAGAAPNGFPAQAIPGRAPAPAHAASPPRARGSVGKRTISGVGSPLHPALAGTLPFGLTPHALGNDPPGTETAGAATTPVTPASPEPAEPFAKAVSWPPATGSLPAPSSDTARSAQPRLVAPAVSGAMDMDLARDDAPPSGALRPSGWSHAPDALGIRRSRSRTTIVAIVATLALGIAVGVALLLRTASDEAPITLAPTPLPAEEKQTAAAPTAATPPAPEPPPAPTPTAAAPEAAAPEPSTPEAPESGVGSDFATPELNDEQLTGLFALERRTELPSCAARLGAGARRHTGKDARKSREQLKAARRELVRGDNDKAHTLLCSATAHFNGNTEAWQALAELALHLGDASAAKLAIEKALKRKPNDQALLGIQGDALALLGDLKRSRTLWAKSAKVTGSGAERTRRLVALFGAIADRKLKSWSHGGALAYYRRAAVLSAGSHGPSAGMGEVLRRLEQPAAAAAWNERVARVFAKEPRPQVAAGRAR